MSLHVLVMILVVAGAVVAALALAFRSDVDRDLEEPSIDDPEHPAQRRRQRIQRARDSRPPDPPQAA